MNLFCFETFSYVSTLLKVSTHCHSCLSRLSRYTKENISFSKGFKIHKADSEGLSLHNSSVLTLQSFVQYNWLLYQNVIMPHKTSRQIPCTDVYYSMLLPVSVTYCHLRGVTHFIDDYIINSKQPYVEGKIYLLVFILIIVQRDATQNSLLFSQFTLHVSGVNHTHHQQYTTL